MTMSKSTPPTAVNPNRTGASDSGGPGDPMAAVESGERVRIQKYLSAIGWCSRRKAEAHILAGRVAVNDRIVTVLGTRIDPRQDRLTVAGQAVPAQSRSIYIALHKPTGVITSCHHPGQPIVLDLIAIPERIYPIGRLDKDSSGLLLLTNDGALHHRLCHPSFDHEKEYAVTVAGPISDGDLVKLRRGVAIQGRQTRPTRIFRTSAKGFHITLQEGRNRQIRRMVRAVGNEVMTLTRIRIGHIHLHPLPIGAWRHLSSDEVKKLLA
jgi:pseudouridine synthase